ncbi:MAG: AraC family transcriptional regulator [Eubacteriales bacterium]|nr:AraC family transcriptional regulator [Eubacteriales bacterium]
MSDARRVTDIMLPQKSQDSFVALRHCGHEQCSPGHTFGPSFRDHYLIHFVAAGRGTFAKAGRHYALGPGQGFLIVPGEVTTYYADMEQPWEYYWFGFAGDAAAHILPLCGLSNQSPLFGCTDLPAAVRRAQRLLDCANLPAPGRDCALLAHMFAFLSLMNAPSPAPPGADPGSDSAYRALQYLQDNFSYAITVEDIARQVGLSRSQLFRVFKAKYGHSVKEALVGYRLDTARRMLQGSPYTVTQICYSCGFTDLNHFSKMFRRRYGCSPRACRRGDTLPPSFGI